MHMRNLEFRGVTEKFFPCRREGMSELDAISVDLLITFLCLAHLVTACEGVGEGAPLVML